MPDGRTYSLDRFKGLDQVGDTGLKDSVNRHYLQVFGASLAIGALSGLAQYGTREQRRRVQFRRLVSAGRRREPRGIGGPRPRSLSERAADDHDPRRLPHQGLSHQRLRTAAVSGGTVRRCSMTRRFVRTTAVLLAVAMLSVPSPARAQAYDYWCTTTRMVSGGAATAFKSSSSSG